MSTASKRAAEWAELAGEVMAILLGALLIRVGWEAFGAMLAFVGALGLVSSSVRMLRGRPQPEPTNTE